MMAGLTLGSRWSNMDHKGTMPHCTTSQHVHHAGVDSSSEQVPAFAVKHEHLADTERYRNTIPVFEAGCMLGVDLH